MRSGGCLHQTVNFVEDVLFGGLSRGQGLLHEIFQGKLSHQPSAATRKFCEHAEAQRGISCTQQHSAIGGQFGTAIPFEQSKLKRNQQKLTDAERSFGQFSGGERKQTRSNFV